MSPAQSPESGQSTVPADPAAIQALINRARLEVETSIDSAQSLLTEAVEHARAGSLQRLEASARHELGLVLRRSSTASDADALRELQHALELHIQLGDVAGQIAGLTELGLHNFQCSDLASALPLLHDAVQLSEQAGQLTELAVATELLGAVYYTMGQYETAREYDEMTLGLATRLGDTRLRVHALDAMASTESALGRHTEAEQRFQQCLDECARLGSANDRPYLEAVTLADLAEARCNASRWTEAMQAASRSATVAEAARNEGLHGQALYSIGLAHVGLGDDVSAESAFLKSHAHFQNSRNKYYPSKVERALSALYRRRGDYAQALEFIERALATETAMKRDAALHQAAQQRARERYEGLRREMEATERVLFNVLPGPIARRIMGGKGRIADEIEDVSVAFADVVGFTELAARIGAGDLLDLLDRIFSRFDELADAHGLAKIKTIGDAYMVAGGIPEASGDHLERMARMVLSMRGALSEINQEAASSLSIRIGMHAGPAIAGVVGSTRLTYDVWGQTINLASRLESSGVPGRIQVSASVRDRLQSTFAFRPRGVVPLKGVGDVETFFLEGALR